MQDIGYDNRNAMMGLATFTFLIIIYFLRVIFAGLMKVFSLAVGGRFFT